MADWDAVPRAEVEQARRRRWEAVFDKLEGAGFDSGNGRGNEMLLDLEQWEMLARVVRRAQAHNLLRSGSARR